MSKTADSKIVIRAKTLQIILKFKDIRVPQDTEIIEAISQLRELGHPEFVLEILLKEIVGECNMYDSVLSILVTEIFDSKMLGEQIFNLMTSKKISDQKKLYLVNLLGETGQKLDYGFVSNCVEDAQGVISSQTKKFLQDAIVSPETQIDFYDFYFAVGEADRQLLMHSMMSDYSGDELANILMPMLYFYPNVNIDKEFLSVLSSTKSYIALNALEWFYSKVADEKLKSATKKEINKMKLSGLRDKLHISEVYKPLLSASKPLGFWFSYIDGRGNLPCVFARQRYEDDTIQTFFTVFNIKLGPIACFGFDRITKDDFDIILSRFFKASISLKPNNEEAKAIFDLLCEPLWNIKRSNFPYEFACWRNLANDIIPSELPINDFLTSGLNLIKVPDNLIFDVLNSNIFSTWFFKYDDFDEFSNLINDILKLEDAEIKKIDDLVTSCTALFLNNEEFLKNLKFQFILQAYLCKNSQMENAANLLYTMSLSNYELTVALGHIIKRSVYEYFLSATNVENINKKSIFTKKNKTIDINLKKNILKILESEWM